MSFFSYEIPRLIEPWNIIETPFLTKTDNNKNREINRQTDRLQPPFKWTCKKREDQPGVSVTMSEFLTTHTYLRK
ncbi:unnamed protein product [Acanthoscelides obtectus]|uniref:Uncharacterized protein n=1 Tax=Acanthoscelides obtectus TaxID=200917 RepID=A0A9P0L0I5_ACAOB|nr:unnamed protein product [Acanthoscelides obtectus]CAK1681085.1 hypothetical protein AOBTE_LOCUS33010 [Acanthoscelides obtectus]